MALLSIRFKNELGSIEEEVLHFQSIPDFLSAQDWSKLSEVTIKKDSTEKLMLLFTATTAGLIIYTGSKKYKHNLLFHNLSEVLNELEQFFFGMYKFRLDSDFQAIVETEIPPEKKVDHSIKKEPEKKKKVFREEPINKAEDPKHIFKDVKDLFTKEDKDQTFKKQKQHKNSDSDFPWHTIGIIISVIITVSSGFRNCGDKPTVNFTPSSTTIKKINAIVTVIDELKPNSPYRKVTYKFNYLGKPMEKSSLDFNHLKHNISVGDTVKIKLVYDKVKQDFVPVQIFMLEQ